MPKHSLSPFSAIVRTLVEYRFVLSLGLSVASGLVLTAMLPINLENPMLLLIRLKQPLIYQALVTSYLTFLYSTPFLAISMGLSFIYVHFYVPDLERQPGTLPEYPDP